MPTTLPRPVAWLPTLGFFLVLAIELNLFWEPRLLFEDPGVGRHLRTAEFILDTHRIPHTDPLSFTHAGQPWLDYEWAFEATMGELYRAGGLGLIAAFGTAIFAATNLVIYRTLLRAGFSMSTVILVWSIVFLTLHLHLVVRPVIFSYLFMALVVEVWQRRPQPLRRDWIFLPVIFVAWANLHAGWSAALAFLCLATFGRGLDRWRKRVSGDDAPVIPWLGMIGVCLVATSINPWGWHLLRQTFLYATTYKSFGLWNEYAQPDFRGPSMSAIAILALLLVVFAARAVRRAPLWRWEMIVPVLFFLWEGLKFQRHVLFLMEVAAVPLARDLEVLLHATWWANLRSRLRDFQAQQRLAMGDAWLSALAMIGVGAIFLHTTQARHLPVGSSVTPKLAAFIRDHPDRFRRPLTTTGNAGPLLWNLRPDFRVSFDDRGDFYGDRVVFDFVALHNASSGWRETLEKNRFDSAILDNYLNLNQVLPLVPGWQKVYRDDKTTVFWKSAAP